MVDRRKPHGLDDLEGLEDVDIGALVDQARVDAAALVRAGPAAVLADEGGWELVDSGVCSVRNMDACELRAAIVSDLVMLHGFEREGLTFDFTRETLVRHLPPDLHATVEEGLADPHVMSFLERRTDGQLRIDPHHLQDACDYCGVYPDGIEPLDPEEIIRAPR